MCFPYQLLQESLEVLMLLVREVTEVVIFTSSRGSTSNLQVFLNFCEGHRPC